MACTPLLPATFTCSTTTMTTTTAGAAAAATTSAGRATCDAGLTLRLVIVTTAKAIPGLQTNSAYLEPL